MKNYLIFLFFLFSTKLFATDYYVSNSGSDSNAGTDTITPWATLSKVNSAIGSTITSGDVIRFKCGETFFGQLNISEPNITIESYGTGEKPVITGLKVLGDFEQDGNIWSIEDGDLPENESYLTGLFIDGNWHRLGRYPDTGFLYFESSSGGTSITDNNASWISNYWQGGEAVVRTKHYIYDRLDISSNTSTTLTFGETPTYDFSGGDNNGFFIQNHDNALSFNGEWNYSSGSDSLKIYYDTNLNSHSIQFPVVDFGIYIEEGANYVVVRDIEVCGFNRGCFSIDDASGVVIDNITASYSNYFFVDVAESANTVVVQNCDISNIFSQSWEVSNVSMTVYKNNFENIGYVPGLDDGGFGYRGMYMEYGSQIIRRNTLKNIGYIGIAFYFCSAQIDSNYIDGFNTVLNDGGAIYTYRTTTGTSNVSHNVIINGGNPDDGGEWHPGVGLYQDNESSGITWEYNVLANVDYAFKENEALGGIMRYNKAFDIGLTDGNQHGWGFNAAFEDHENFTFTNNIMVGNEYLNYVWNTWTNGLNFTNSNFDYNYWIAPWGSSSSIFRHRGVDYSLSSWRSSDPFGDWDDNSKTTPVTYSGGETYAQKIKHYINPTMEDSVISLSAAYTWIDIDGNSVSGQQSIAPYDGEVFFIIGECIDCASTPIISGIPDQTINSGETFASVNLDDFVEDADTPDSLLTWEQRGGTSLTVVIGNRVADISYPVGWTGIEDIIFTASDGVNSDSDTVRFEVKLPEPVSCIEAQWLFNNNDTDETGNYPLSVTGGYYSSSSAEGDYSLNVDGSGYHAQAGTIDFGDKFTIAGWYRVSGTSYTRTLFSNTNGSTGNGFIAFMDASTGTFYLQTGNGSSSITAQSTSGNHTSYTWTHFAYVIDKVAGNCQIYINGQDVTSSDSIKDDFTTNAAFYIGINSDLSDQLWGYLDDMQVYKTELSQSDIQYIYQNPGISLECEEAPVISNIPDQTIYSGESFSDIQLDDYVIDADTPDSLIVWSNSNNTDLSVDITDRLASISYATGWTGSEQVVFTASDGTNTSSDTAIFQVLGSDTTECIEAQWLFNNNGDDETGNYPLTVTGGYYSTSSIEGAYSLNVDGSGYNAQAGTIDFGDQFTILGWYRVSGTSYTRPLFSNTTGTTGDGFIAYMDASTGIFYLQTGNGSSSVTAQSTSGNHTSYTWTHFAYVVDKSTGSCQIYINGQDVTSSDSIRDDFTTNAAFYIGVNSDLSDQLWGYLDDMQVYKTELSQSDIQYIYQNPGISLECEESPVISNIPDQTIYSGESFSDIQLDDYVIDADTPDSLITWTYSGDTNLVVTISDRVASISYAIGWTGSEEIIFTASDGSGSDNDTVIFQVNSAPSPQESIKLDESNYSDSYGVTVNSYEINSWHNDDYVMWANVDLDNVDSIIFAYTGGTETNRTFDIRIGTANGTVIHQDTTPVTADWSTPDSLSIDVDWDYGTTDLYYYATAWSLANLDYIRVVYEDPINYSLEISDLYTSPENIDLNTEESILMYPIPVKDLLTIVLNNIDETDIYNAQLYNMQGRVVKIIELKSSTNVISLEEFISGIYVIKINGDRNFVRTIIVE